MTSRAPHEPTGVHPSDVHFAQAMRLAVVLATDGGGTRRPVPQPLKHIPRSRSWQHQAACIAITYNTGFLLHYMTKAISKLLADVWCKNLRPRSDRRQRVVPPVGACSP